MLDELDRQEIDNLIADRIDILSAFKGLDVAQLEELGQQLEPFLYSRQIALRKPKNTYTPRITVSGNDINANAAAAGSGHAGPTLPRWIDFAGATGYLDTDDPQMVHIVTAGGGADCMFSVIVSSCFSSVTGWVEGATYTSLSGCSFSTSLLPQLAADYIRDVYSGSGAVYICKGTYTGMHIHHDTTVDVIGAGRDVTILAGVGTGSTSYVADSGTSAVCSFRDLTIDGTSGTAPSLAVYGNANACTTTLSHITLKVPASNNGAQFNGNETIDDLVITGPSSGTQALTGFTSANNTSPHTLNGCRITGCGAGMEFTNASLWKINNVYISGANAARAGADTGGLSFGTSGGLSNSQLSNVTIVDSIVGINFRNDSGINTVLTGFVIKNCVRALDIRGTTTGITGWIFDDFKCVLGTAGDIGIDWSAADSSPGTRYSQFTNFNFTGYASGNEIISVANIGTGTVGYHNISDAGTVADFGSPLGHVGSGSGGAAPNDAQYLVLAANATLTSERIWTPGNGLQGTDSGAGAAYTAALGNLTGNWTQAGVFDISTAGNLTVLKHLAVGSGAAIDANIIQQFAETITANGANLDLIAVGGSLTRNLTAADAGSATGVSVQATVSGAFADTGVNVGVTSLLQRSSASTSATMRNFDSRFTAGAGSTTTDRFAYYASNAVSTGAVTNQYGFYVPAFTKGGTANWAFYSVSAKSAFGGSVAIGSTSTPSTSAILDLSNAANLAVLLPQVATASLPTPVNGEIVYDSTTATAKAYAGSAYYNLTHLHEVVLKVDGSITTQKTGARVPSAGTITNVTCKTDDGVTVGATAWIGTIYKVPVANIDTDGGTTEIFTTRPTITNTHMAQNYGAPDLTTSVAAGDWLFAATTQAGTVASGTPVTLAIEIRY